MKQHIAFVAVVVRDYDEAKEYYTSVLGFLTRFFWVPKTWRGISWNSKRRKLWHSGTVWGFVRESLGLVTTQKVI